MVELHKVDRNTRIDVSHLHLAIIPKLGNQIDIDELNFHGIDGMYSYCTTDCGRVVHLKSWTKVKVIK